MKKAIIILAALLMVSVAANVVLWTEATKPAEVKVETRTKYIEMRDTTPNEIECYLTGETMAVPAVVRPKNHNPDEPVTELEPDTMATVSIDGDSATVTLPVEQRVYEDSLYTAYVSGYRPRLDSIALRLPHTYTTVTTTVSKPSRRWAVGPAVGVGYGITGRQLDVFVGVSVTWNILK